MRIRFSFVKIFLLYNLSAFSSLSSHEECCCITRVFSSSAKSPSTNCHGSVAFETPNQTILLRLDTAVLKLPLVWTVKLSQNKANLDSFFSNLFHCFLNASCRKSSVCPSILLKIYINTIISYLALVVCYSLSLPWKNNGKMWWLSIWSKA